MYATVLANYRWRIDGEEVLWNWRNGLQRSNNAQDTASKRFSILFGRQQRAVLENIVQNVSVPILRTSLFQSALSSTPADRRDAYQRYGPARDMLRVRPATTLSHKHVLLRFGESRTTPASK